ncbi:MAG: hypothetical protein ABIH46_04385 [Chloroflexota bacterium]
MRIEAEGQVESGKAAEDESGGGIEDGEAVWGGTMAQRLGTEQPE